MKVPKKLTANLLIIGIILFMAQLTYSQDYSSSPYEWKWGRDGVWTGVTLGASAYGLYLIQEKEGISEAELNALDADDINFIDRWVAGNSSESANNISDIPFAASFATPFLLLFDDEVNDHTGQVLGMYLQSLSTTSALYSITAGVVNRSRPYVYDENNDLDRRLSNNGQRSFYSGHVAAAASATFFAAKVYSDFNPDSPGKAWVWTGAAVIPAAVGYFRLQAGQHFLTDVILGYGLGAAMGILIPEMHKLKDSSFSLYPASGINDVGVRYRAIGLNYKF